MATTDAGRCPVGGIRRYLCWVCMALAGMGAAPSIAVEANATRPVNWVNTFIRSKPAANWIS
jgi:hypothetical protein